MLNLSATTDKLELVTSSGADIDVHASYVDVTTATGATAAGRKNTQPTTAATTDISGSPTAGDVRNIKFLNIRNIDGSVSNDVTPQFNQNGTIVTLLKVTLLAGESLVMREGVWFHFAANGEVYTLGVTPATQSDMESASSLTAYVTPGRLHYHPAAAKCWGEFTGNSTTILTSYNITSLADTATGAMTVTIGTDFSSANWACFLARAEDDLTLVYSATYDAKTAGTVILRSAVEAGSGSDPSAGSGNASWSFAGFGDH